MAESPDPSFSANNLPPTPVAWRLCIAALIFLVGGVAYALRETMSLQLISGVGFLCLIALAACFSRNLRAVNWRTIGCGVLLQLALAVLILKWEVHGLEFVGIADGFRPVYELFNQLGDIVRLFINFSNKGAEFVFGKLADRRAVAEVFGGNNAVLIAFQVLPPIIFVSSFFSVLYYFGILQFLVRWMARLMMYLLGTSGAETLSASANVFMGQTEAPLIVKPYISGMTQSELMALMAGGMATVAGAVLVAYVSFGADQVALLATSVMAAPCGLYLAKLVWPEVEQPETSGIAAISKETPHVNAIDAAASGAADGLKLALNVGAMLIAFLALLALADYLLGLLATGRPLWETMRSASPWAIVFDVFVITLVFSMVCWLANRIATAYRIGRTVHCFFGAGSPAKIVGNVVFVSLVFVLFVAAVDWILANSPHELHLKDVFATLFAPLAFLIGVPDKDIANFANLLGTKIVANEFVAFINLKELYTDPLGLGKLPAIDYRSHMLASYALTGFANFGSVGIQIGGIGALAPERRSDLARLGMRALLVGFLATLINAALAGMLSDFSPPAASAPATQ